jgi:hypothetical protein
MTPTTTIAFPFHLPTAQVAWDLVICHHYPMENVATQLHVSREELQYMLLVLAMPWEKSQIN